MAYEAQATAHLAEIGEHRLRTVHMITRVNIPV